MKNAVLAIVALLFAPLLTFSQEHHGPFGFEKGMTRDEIIKLVGKEAIDVQGSKDDVLELHTAPKPHQAFESYVLIISPTKGLLKVAAVGKTISTGDSGMELRTAFGEILTVLTRKYGTAKTYDMCGGSGCSSPQYWMLSLIQKNRTLEAYWKPTEPTVPTSRISTIGLMTKALGINSGYIMCGFEFEGFEEYSATKNATQNENL